MAENIRGTSGSGPLIIATANTNYLGLEGGDIYIISRAFVQNGDTISINDTDGDNRVRLTDGLEIVSSQIATLSDGVVQLFLTH